MSRKLRAVRPHPTDPTLALVELTRGYWAVIDAVDAVEVGKHNWFAGCHGGTKTIYAETNNAETGWISLHRFIAGLHGIDLANLIDHRNQNGLDCRQSNLRPATKATNAQNSRLGSSNTSGVKGVHFEAFTGRWRAEIWSQGKHIRLGRFDTRKEAAAAVRTARAAHHGEFASEGTVH
jgi:hypothetical protein